MSGVNEAGTTSGDLIIDVRGLGKRFGRVRALDGLDLSVSAGEVHGFLGPNGAGKSTTLRVLLGLARASFGSVTVFGQDPWKDAAKLHRRLAYVPGDVSLWPNLSGGEAIDLISRLRGGTADRAAYARAKDRLTRTFALDPGKKGRTYSKGNRQKVALVAAFATPAELYILDEPSSGLDPLMEAVFGQEIQRVSAAGATVLLSSHILSEVEHLCSRVSIIRAGKTVETGTLAQMRHLTRTGISFAAEGLGQEQLGRIPGAHELTVSGGRVSFTTDTDEVSAVLPMLAALKVQGLTVQPPSLEELFLRHYGDEAEGPKGRRAAEAAAR
ncbi:ABC transporter ATP-binding protein [Arthrobacter sp. H14-L1]|nr:ABC transporter ATP-binding protein [Arthrobacter sp. H14-L1]MCY0905196.1 ABC transporter ATP-binding protein [Arthrobacter sp. H14-L1]